MKTIVVLFNKMATHGEKTVALETIRSFDGVKKVQGLFDESSPRLNRIATVDLKKKADADGLVTTIEAIKNVEMAYVAPTRTHQ